ncbi:MAG TPA: hypothetical protein VFS39_18175 [Nitrospira sp.]|nr:hypothetical protein [Nitrospira sp.]
MNVLKNFWHAGMLTVLHGPVHTDATQANIQSQRPMVEQGAAALGPLFSTVFVGVVMFHGRQWRFPAFAS